MAHRRVPRVALPALAGTLAAAFLLVNATYSYSTMSTSSDYYLTLNNENVDLLNWLADHTNSTARILLASPALTSWVQGYSNRLAFSPVPFNLVITSASYSVANSGWLMAMGQYVSGNGYMAVGENLPAWDSDPAIYLLTPYGWTTLENANSGDVHFEVRERNTTLRLTTENAVVTAANLSSPCAGCSGQNLTLSWPWTGVVISQTVEVVGQTAVLRWTGEVGTLLSTELRMAMPPSNYQGLEHEDVPDVASAARLSDRFTLYGNPLSVTISGANGEFNQTTVPDGWTYINYTGGSRLTWSMNGLRPTAGKTPFSLTASSLVRQLDVSYLVADSTDFFPGFGYSLYLRCTTPDGFGGIVAREAYLNDGLYVFHLT